MGKNEKLKTSITYVLNDKMGGITSLNIALAKSRPPNFNAFQHFLFYHYKESKDARYNMMVPEADRQTMLEYSKLDNIYYVFKKFKQKLSDGEGVLISNDVFELHYINSFGTQKAVYQIVHDDYNLKLSCEYETIIDVFIAHSRFIYNQLINKIPHRKDCCFFLPYGIEIKSFDFNKPKTKQLNLVFLGRLSVHKGVYDLPKIDKQLQERNIPINWTIIGRGPEKEKLMKEWHSFNPNVQFISPDTTDGVFEELKKQDIFVFPTRFEGFPVALLETMSLGVVPIAPDIPSGIPELVNDETGYLVKPNQTQQYVDIITDISKDKTMLMQKSKNARKKVVEHHELNSAMKRYHDLFAKYSAFKRKHKPKRIIFGSRLDKWWLPNFIVRFIRKFIY